MTGDEVMATLGMPPGDYATGFVVPMAERSECNRVEWVSDEGMILVWFDEHGKVERREFRHVVIWKVTWYERIRKWLRF